MPKLTAIYARRSSSGQTLASQRPDLEAWAQAHGGPVRWFDDCFTGKTMQRPGMDALLAGIRAGKIGTVVVWRLDRLGRTAAGLTTLLEELFVRGVNLVSLRDGLDLSTPAGRLLANVLASVAAFETEVRAERVAAGQAAARAKGKRWGGSKPGRRLKVRPEQIGLIGELRKSGRPIAQIARATGLSRPTVYHVLRSLPPAAAAAATG